MKRKLLASSSSASAELARRSGVHGVCSGSMWELYLTSAANAQCTTALPREKGGLHGASLQVGVGLPRRECNYTRPYGQN